MKGCLFSLLVGLALFVLTAGNIWAQATAQIAGTVKDQTGAVLPGVEVTATQADTGISRMSVTNETGSYVLVNLPVGIYRLSAELPGFKTYAQTGIILDVNASPVINPILEVGQVAEQVEVQANAAQVDTRTSGIGQVMENTRILDLPLNGRAMIDLVSLSGSANPAPILNGTGGRDPFSKGNVSVAGGLNTGLNYTLDGAYHNNPYSASYMSMPFPDALQEFKVETGATAPQNGVKSAGSVSLVTKSGTNEIHGNAFEFVRNGIFNARNEFATRRDTIKRNQFGGTFGGPIVKNKLFFFAGYQGTTFRQDPSELIGFVPTAAELAGDFTSYASPACNSGRQVTLKAPFINNRIDPKLFSPAAVLLSSKLPSSTDPCGKSNYGMPAPENDHTVIARIDYQRSANHSIFGRFLLDTVYISAPFDVTHNLMSVAANATGNNGRDQGYTLGDTYLIGSNVVNTFRLTGNRIYGAKFSPNFPVAAAGPTDLGIKAFAYEPHTPSYSVTGGFATGYNGAGATSIAVFAANDDVSIIHGNHQLGFGAQVADSQVNSYSDQLQKMAFTFNGQTTGLGMADFLLGDASALTMGTASDQNKGQHYFGVYGTDSWKVKQRLTFNYGIRWEPYFPLFDIDGSAINFNMNNFIQGVKTARFTNAPPGISLNGDPGFPGLSGMRTQWKNLSPRVGVAWDVRGDGRTSLRASAGTFYDFPTALFYQGLTTGAPFTPRVNRTNVNFDSPWAGYPGGDPFPLAHGRGTPVNAPWQLSSPINDLDYNTPNMRVTQLNVSLQQQVGDWLLSANYLGNMSRHLWSLQQLNPAVYIPGNCSAGQLGLTVAGPCSTTANQEARRLLTLNYPQNGPLLGYISHVDSGGTANYNGMILSVQRRAARGVTVTANYTYSHCISDEWDASTNSGVSGTGWVDPNNRHFSRGNCFAASTDRRQILNFSAVAQTPRFSNNTLRAVGSGWSLSPIFRVLSGDQMSISTNQDRALNSIVGQRVSQVLGNPYGAKTTSSYLNPNAFALPAMGTLGNVGVASVAGPGYWQLDVALSRTFQVREGQRVEFRAESFNLPNTMRMMDPDTTLNSSTFGQVLAAMDPRIMQFALKYFF